MKTRVEVREGHKGPAIVWPFDPWKEWPGRERQFVGGTLNGARFEGEIAKRRSVFYTCVPDDLLAAAKIVPDAAADAVVAPREPTEAESAAHPRLVSARLVARASRKRR